MQKILKNEKGSISLFILLAALFFLVVVTGVGVSLKNKEAEIDAHFEKTKASYEKDAEQVYNEMINNIDISTNYGTIDVIWLQGKTNTIATTPNQPYMYSGFEKVAWRDDGTEFTPTQNNDWYSYNSISGKEDNKTSKWANAKNTADGSYFVWIPRFAYRITYWDSAERNNITGYFDGRGMVDANGNIVTKEVNGEKKQITLDAGINTVTKNGVQYIVHPAFDNSVDNGGWKNKLSGFWVAKYEMSRENYDSTSNSWIPNGTVSYGGGDTEINSSNNTTIRTVSKPNVTSWRNIKIGFSYTNSYNYDRTKESHLMKNSEWGTVAYLTHSQYGRNGKEISENQCKGYITGAGKGTGEGEIYNSVYDTDSATGLPSTSQQYNGEIGKLSSSTGNVYGIYDLSGGAWEYVAGFDRLGDSAKVAGAYGLKMTENAKNGDTYINTEYITVYSNGTETYSGVLLYNIGKNGDATKEVYKCSETLNWFEDNSNYVSIRYPFFLRGGAWTVTSDAGVFYSNIITSGSARERRVIPRSSCAIEFRDLI